MRLFVVRMMIIFAIFFFLFPNVGQSMEQTDVSAQHAILMEMSTGRVIYEKEAHEQQPIASITKVMTAIIALEYGELKDKAVASERAAMHGSSIYLEQDEEMTLEDLLYGLMLRSGNDAAVVIAEHIGGSVEGFVYLMNEKARYLGMTNTHFMNPHGLDEEQHYSSAYDMAILMKYAMENDTFREISRTKSYQSKNRSYQWNNKNKLLTQFYEHSTGGKTGYTKKAGRTLVTTANQDNLSFIVVTLNASDDWNDHMHLFEKGFEEYELVKLEKKGKRTFIAEETFITGYLEEDVIYPLQKVEQAELTRHAILYNHTNESKIGKIIYSLGDTPIIEVPVYGKEQTESNFMSKMKRIIQNVLRLDDNG